MTSAGGALLWRETDRRSGLLARLAACFDEQRKPWLAEHCVAEMVAQRVYALALGYADLNDHDELRARPRRAKSTLNRLELGPGEAHRYKKMQCRQEAIDRLLGDVFLEAHAAPPERIVLDLDSTDLPLFFPGDEKTAGQTPQLGLTVAERVLGQLAPARIDADFDDLYGSAAAALDEARPGDGDARAVLADPGLLVASQSLPPSADPAKGPLRGVALLSRREQLPRQAVLDLPEGMA